MKEELTIPELSELVADAEYKKKHSEIARTTLKLVKAYSEACNQLTEKDATIKRLETALFTHQSYDKTVCELREELEQRDATIKKLQDELKRQSDLKRETYQENAKWQDECERLRKSLKAAERSILEGIGGARFIIHAALGEGEKQVEAKVEFNPETDPLLRIYQYIEKCGYTYSPQDVLVGYQKYQEGYYVSHTMKDCIANLESELKALLGEGDKE